MKAKQTIQNRAQRFGGITVRILIAGLILLLTVSCGADTKNDDLLAYQRSAFCATVHGEISGAPFEAQITHTLPTETSGADTLTLTFTSPTALAGITLQTQSSAATVSLGDMHVDATAWQDSAWFEILGLFSLQGAPLSVTTEKDGGELVIVFERTDGEAFTVTTEAQNGTPRFIEGDGIWVEVISFE